MALKSELKSIARYHCCMGSLPHCSAAVGGQYRDLVRAWGVGHETVIPSKSGTTISRLCSAGVGRSNFSTQDRVSDQAAMHPAATPIQRMPITDCFDWVLPYPVPPARVPSRAILARLGYPPPKEKQSRRDRAGFGRRLAVYDRALAAAAGWWRRH